MVHTIKKIDRIIGSPLVRCLGATTVKKQKPSNPKKVAFIQLWGIGETILTLPTIKAFNEKYPNCEITIVCTNRVKSVFKDQDYITKIIDVKTSAKGIAQCIQTHRNEFDIVFDFEEYLNVSSVLAYFLGKYRVGYDTNKRSNIYHETAQYNDKQHVVETHLDLIRKFGIVAKTPKTLIPLSYSKEDEKKVNQFLKEKIHSEYPLVICAPMVAESAKSRMWPFEKWIELINQMQTKYHAQIVFMGSPDEKSEIRKNIATHIKHKTCNAAGELSLSQVYCLLSKADLVISNDSGPMHMGAAMGANTIGLFGPNIPQRWKPFGKKNVGIYHGNVCEFSPCINVHKGIVPECLQPNQNNICMQEIEVDEVFATASSFLATKK